MANTDPSTSVPERSGNPEERRTSERTQCFLEVAIVDARSDFVAARAIDISTGGVRLLVDPSPAPGEELCLTFSVKDGRLFQIPATVVHYLDQGGTWAVGCRFARDLTPEEFEALF
jgi:hypothetical protein